MRQRGVWLTALLLVGFAGLSLSRAQDAENLLENGGFETGDLTGWNTYGSVTTEVVDTLDGAAVADGPIEGTYCLHLVVPSAGANFWDSGLQHQGHVFETGKKYTLSAFLKCNEGELQINFKPELGQDPWTGYGAQSFTMTEEWQEFSVTTPVFTEDVDPATITFHIAYTAGDFWIDGVRFYEGDYVPPALGPRELASRPTPGDGDVIDVRMIELGWKPGEFAASHDVYVGESFDDVNDSVADAFVGNVADPATLVGAPGTPFPDGLVPGQTYYWRVDEVNDANAASPWKGNVWSFTVRPLNAWSPTPADGMKFVDPNQDLTWQPGLGNLFHTVFFGESFEEVDTATVGAMLSEPTYDPGTLDPNTTYYWRVDQFSFPGSITTKGDVWSFTTLAPGGGVKAEYFAGMELAGDPILTQIEDAIDHDWGDGEVAGGLADQVSARWTADLEAPLSGTYTLITTSDDGVRLWLDGLLIVNNWTNHGATDDLATVELEAGQIYSIQMEWYEDGGGAVAQLSWTSEFLPRQIIPGGALQPPARAGVPSPGNGEDDVFQTVTLTWLAGEDAAEHLVYFGDDAEAIANATEPDSRQAAANTSYNVGTLEWDKTYYWRVDEVLADGTVLEGKVWEFTTADFLVVDDFESYTNDSPNRVFQTWIDGLGFSADEFFPNGDPGNGTGAIVGYDPAAGDIMETSIVHGDEQSMPVSYDNTFAPGISEAERSFVPAKNWTLDGVTTLVVYFRGEDGNTGDLYLKINGTKIPYNGDPADIASVSWKRWEVDLAATGANVTNVTQLTIGIEGGESGMLYIDDILLTR